jgi:hypothetical protein
MVPALEVADNETVPASQRFPGVVLTMEGVLYTVATTAVRVAEGQVPPFTASA